MTVNAENIAVASVFQYLLVWELVILSIVLLMIQIRTRTVYIWLCANAVAILGNLFVAQVIGTGEVITSPSGEALLMSSSVLKALSFADRGLTRKSNRIPSLFIIIVVISIVIGFVLGETKFRMIFVSISGIFLSISAIF